jgi:hypothetical protein
MLVRQAGCKMFSTAPDLMIRTRRQIPLPARRLLPCLTHPAIQSRLHCRSLFRTRCRVRLRIQLQIRLTQYQLIRHRIQPRTLRLILAPILVVAAEMDPEIPARVATEAEETAAVEAKEEVAVVKEEAGEMETNFRGHDG